MNKIVIGITGPIASGKHIVIEELEKMGFKTFFLGDRTREEADGRGLPHDRAILQDMGNDLREKFGDAVLVQLTEKFIVNTSKVVIDGIRNAGEIKYLREKYNAFIIGVNTPVDIREKLSKKRAGDADPKTIEEFRQVEKRDRGIGEGPHGQQVDECLKIANIVLINDGTEEELRQKARNVLTR